MVTRQPDHTMSDLIEFLKEDLTHLFDEQGIDQSKYDPKVVFEDPITKHTSLQGYLFNIAFLRTVFAPNFTLLDIKKTAPFEITTRWSMLMYPTFIRVPAIQKIWNPSLAFTGTSIMKVDPQTGLFISHKDTWDAIQNQNFFSIEAFIHMLSQSLEFKRTPLGLSSPGYTLLLKKQAYEVRQYHEFTVAETPMVSTSSPSNSAFGKLAGYIFGNNMSAQKMAMTTPVFSTTNVMQFYINTTSSPQPLDETVKIKKSGGSVYAVLNPFSGIADDVVGGEKAKELTRLVEKDGLKINKSKQWVLARYNDPGTPVGFRKNEVLVELEEFVLHI